MRTKAHVAYASAQRPMVDSDDIRNTSCPRVVNGLGPHDAGIGCLSCDARLRVMAREMDRHTYRVRDANNNVIVADWIYAT